MERIVSIVDAVHSGKHPNCRSLAEELEVSAKTVQRDINFIRDRLHYPIEYDELHYGYYFSREVSDLDRFDVQVEDLAALFLAKQTMGALKGTRMARAMEPTFEKLTTMLEGKVNLSSSDLADVFSVTEAGVGEADLSRFGKLAEAVLKQQEVSFMYFGVGDSDQKRRRVQPYHVGEVNGGWYMMGVDTEKGAMRTYALPRMKSLVVLKSQFERDGALNVGFSGGIGAWSSEQEFDVCLEVSGWVYQLVQERVWHHTQEVNITDSESKLAKVTLSVSSLEELVSLVLSWGQHVKIISPRKLLQLVQNEVKKMKH